MAAVKSFLTGDEKEDSEDEESSSDSEESVWLSVGSTDMWQSRVEIERYSVAHFDRITVFKALQHKTFIKGGAHTHSEDTSILDKSM